MLLVLIAMALAGAYIFIDYNYDEDQKFDYNTWLRKKYQPNWSPEKELEDMLDNAEEHWKDYL